MGIFKWIGGFIGWAAGGPIGAILGVVIGSLFESDQIRQVGGGGFGGGFGGGSSGGYGGGNGQNTYGQNAYGQAQRNSFLISLLVLSSAVIRADGRFLQSEMDYVRSFIRRNFGPQAEGEAMRILEEVNRKEINVYEVGRQIASNMNYSQRLQLLHYLADLANADGDFCAAEKNVLEAIAGAIGVTPSDAASILAMFARSDESAYTVLEISPTATDDEVKSAYRRLAMKNHPDKVATLGPDVQKAAAEKFRKIQEAYDRIKKERGMA